MIKKLLTCLFIAGVGVSTATFAQNNIAGNYDGELTVTVMEIPTVTSETISLVAEEGGTYALSVKDFSYGEGEDALVIGDLNVDGITASETDGTVTLTKETAVAGPVVQEIMQTQIKLTSANVAGNTLNLNLDVLVYVTTPEEPVVTVGVAFTGTKASAGIAGNAVETLKIFASPESNAIHVSGQADAYVIFNTAGAMVQHGVINNGVIDIAKLKGGIYLMKVNSRIFKFIKK